VAGWRVVMPVTADRAGWALVELASQRGLLPPGAAARGRQLPEIDLMRLLEELGGAAARRGDDRLAERFYQGALNEGSARPAVPFNLGNIAMRAGRRREAIEWYSRAIRLDPGLGRAYYNRGVQKRLLGDEPGTRSDIAAGIERGYDGLEACAALLRGRSGEFGDPVEALERAVAARQNLAAGDVGAALTVAELESGLRRSRAGRGLRAEVALVVALENERDICEQVGDIGRALTAGAELVRVCERLAGREASSWAGVPDALRQFAVGQLPRRLLTMARLYTQMGRHQDALAAAEAAQRRGGGPHSRSSPADDPSVGLASAVYAELRRRAAAGE